MSIGQGLPNHTSFPNYGPNFEQRKWDQWTTLQVLIYTVIGSLGSHVSFFRCILTSYIFGKAGGHPENNKRLFSLHNSFSTWVHHRFFHLFWIAPKPGSSLLYQSVRSGRNFPLFFIVLKLCFQSLVNLRFPIEIICLNPPRPTLNDYVSITLEKWHLCILSYLTHSVWRLFAAEGTDSSDKNIHKRTGYSRDIWMWYSVRVWCLEYMV